MSVGIFTEYFLHTLLLKIGMTLCFVLIDLRRLYWKAGVQNTPTVFLFTDNQVVEESFLEDINNVLSSGEVPNLYKPDEFEEVSGCVYISFFLLFPFCRGEAGLH